MQFFSRRKPQAEAVDNAPATKSPARSAETEQTLTQQPEGVSKAQLKRATRTRKIWTLISSFFLLVSVIFLILVEVGNTRIGKVLNSIYFLKLDLSEIVPTSVPNSGLINTIAQTLGLHDYYQVGLWNFCEGYVGQGMTHCSKPRTLYWFNPVEILLNELLAGATIALPTDVIDVLDILKLASQWMFGLFLTGTCVEFVMIFIVPLSVYSRWVSFVVAPLTFFAALCTTIATVLATVMFIIFQNAAGNVAELNIKANIGKKMFAFMWIATAFAILAWLIQLCLLCCCASRRDIKKGKKKGSKHAYENAGTESEKPKRNGIFGRKKE